MSSVSSTPSSKLKFVIGKENITTGKRSAYDRQHRYRCTSCYHINPSISTSLLSMGPGTARVDHSGTITDVDTNMPQRRRSSLLDQMAMVAAHMEDISEGEIEDGVLPSDDNETVGETEMVFNTELDDASNEYSIDLAGSQNDEEVSMMDFDDEDIDEGESNTMDFDGVNAALGLAPMGRAGNNFRARPSFQVDSMNQPQSYDFASLMYGPGEGGLGGRASSAEGGMVHRGSRVERRRPLSISLPNAAGAVDSIGHGAQQRRVSNRIGSIGEEPTTPHRPHSILSFARRASRKASMGNNSGGDAFGSAIEKLKHNDSNNEWESVAAAVAVVQEGERRATNTNTSRLNQFSAGDTVLVFLTLLNVTNSEDPKDTFTIAAVNRFGYPEGEGKTEDERKGPYNFVLATVKQLHFEEDDRYYTVVRADTGSEQRADSGWMEPLTDPAGQEAARRAAKKTIRSQSNDNIELADDGGYMQDLLGRITDAILYPAFYVTNTLFPGYRKLRVTAKVRVSQLLYGDSPFACRVRVTGINLLVLCSLIFLFLEVANLAFMPPHFDKTVSLVVLVAWCCLVIEWLLELLIRPPDYYELMESDKAFSPTTARYISFFHTFFEAISLATFLPELWCIIFDDEVCFKQSLFSRSRSSMEAVLGHSAGAVMVGRILMGITAFRFFAVVRHWKQALINDTYKTGTNPFKRKRLSRTSAGDSISSYSTALEKRKKKTDELDDSDRKDEGGSKRASSAEDERLKNAATIGTALMVVNSQRALVLLTSIVIILPLLVSRFKTNSVSTDLTRVLQANNAQAMEMDDCDFLKSAVDSWLNMAMVPQPESFGKAHEDTFVIWAQVLPVRCDWQREDGIITYCDDSTNFMQGHKEVCDLWEDTLQWGMISDSQEGWGLEGKVDAVRSHLAEELNLRMPAIQWKCFQGAESAPCSAVSSSESQFNVTVFYNNNPTVSMANKSLFFLLMGILMLGLYSLQALRSDAIRLVLDPLQRMLKIVLQYADNPLSHGVMKSSSNDDDFALEKDVKEIGNYETEQLISAITKIADLLRKCWGIAGAGIISSNLARTVDGKTVVFNPTVPGKRVYALFGFVAIGGFSDQLRRLDRDVMILINDVARVVHDEVYRWALGDHGQCNKNLGPAFLMVFRIGDFSEVHKKKQVATEKLFRSNKGKRTGSGKSSGTLRNRRGNRGGARRSTAGADAQIDLASLPGIQGFTDRALLGMLKSFAGVHRDKNLYVWQSDFRLSDGVGKYCVDIIYGMDAGWAVEGAVGSEYKIDATYLSPHVNMASRMMSATKQYGVTILLSKAVEELLSKNCRRKLRHLDTVYVKGSNVKQQIFTYDARHQGVDFFLIERSPQQADIDAEAYTPNVWDHDQDVKAMRQHISEAFLETFSMGVKEYLGGNWTEAYNLLEQADNKLIGHILDEGYIELDPDEIPGDIYDRSNTNEELVRLRHDLGDGACRVLMAYMKSRNLTAPPDWDGVRKLESK